MFKKYLVIVYQKSFLKRIPFLKILYRRVSRIFVYLEALLFYVPNFDVSNSSLAAFKKNRFFESFDDFGNEVEKILSHRFDLLGSGEKQMGKFIDWHMDFKSGYKWPLKYYKLIEYGNETGVDVKVPWELSRFQHLLPLAQAYKKHGDKKYLDEIVFQILDWIEKNPYKIGVNWKCTMDVGIRAANWLVALDYIKRDMTDADLLVILNSLWQHGHFIMGNLEFSPTLTSNHYVANIAGLFYISVYCGFSDKWLDFAVVELEREIVKQTKADGGNFEGSMPYHRLVLEMFAYCAFLGKKAGYSFSDDYLHVLREMFTFAKGFSDEAYNLPQIGDNDSGRFLILENYSSKESLNIEYLLRLGQNIFGDVDFLKGTNGSMSFPESGFYKIKRGSFEVFVCGENLGQNGNGGHNHNDMLSYSISCRGLFFVVDPGSYIYTPHPKLRNQFRSSKMHNTITMDDQEINSFLKSSLWSMQNFSAVQLVKLDFDGDEHELELKNTAYERLKNPVTHSRNFVLNGRNLTVRDQLVGEGAHELYSKIIFDPQVQVVQVERGDFILSRADNSIGLRINSEVAMDINLINSEFSPKYGVKVCAPAIEIRSEVVLPLEIEYIYENKK